MRFLDLFSGIGGFRKGFEDAGHECIGFCEFDKYAVASYTSMYLINDEQRKYLETLSTRERQKEILKEEYRNGEWYSNDITKVNGEGIPKADCWCFGAPCQSFSVAGKRAGLEGQSGLIREVFRILREIAEEDRPEWLVYENVKGMFSSNRGLDYLAILTEMDECGYDVQWETVNSKFFGVPQNRERVYTVGHLRRLGPAKVFPLGDTDAESSVPKINIIAHKDGYRRNTQTFMPDGITEALDTAQGGGRGHHVAIELVCKVDPNRHSQMDVVGPNGVSPTLDTMHEPKKVAIPIRYGSQDVVKGELDTALTLMSSDYKGIGGRNQDNNAVCIPVLTPDRINKRQNGRRFKENGDPSFTLTAQDRHGVAIGINMSGNEATENDGISHCLNANDQRKVFGANQERTLAAVLIDGDPDAHDGIYVDLGDDCVVYAVWNEKYESYIAIRRLTPRECFRLQGFDDDLYDKAEFVNSDTQLYKQAGNAVTVNVTYEVGKRLK